MARTILAAVLGALAFGAVADKRTVVVTGATGRTGYNIYKRFVAEGVYNVRAFVRNATKAKSVLGCTRCDEAEGIFEGDITKPDTLDHVMKGTDVLAIATASAPHCSGGLPIPGWSNCTYRKGATPKEIDWLGTKAQVTAFANASGDYAKKQIIYASTGATTQPDNFLDKLGGGGFTSFYHLQAEANIMSSGIAFTIAKACRLADGVAGKYKLTVGHDDEGSGIAQVFGIARDDVARVLVEAIKKPELGKNLRFDLCSSFFGAPTKDADIADEVLKPARFDWQSPENIESTIVV